MLKNCFTSNIFISYQKSILASIRCLSTSSNHLAQYGPSWVDPNPDPESYIVDVNDELSKVKLKAAPSSQTYSAYYDSTLHNFKAHILKQGKQALASKIMRQTLEHIKCVQIKKYNATPDLEKDDVELNPLVIFHTALENAKPIVGVKRLTRGAQAYQVPYPLSPQQQFFMTVKWMLNHVRSGKPNTPAAIRLGNELLAAYNGEGVAMKRKQELHKLAESNRAYAHFRWKKSLGGRAAFSSKQKSKKRGK